MQLDAFTPCTTKDKRAKQHTPQSRTNNQILQESKRLPISRIAKLEDESRNE
jgi:hypothetical protein